MAPSNCRGDEPRPDSLAQDVIGGLSAQSGQRLRYPDVLSIVRPASRLDQWFGDLLVDSRLAAKRTTGSIS